MPLTPKQADDIVNGREGHGPGSATDGEGDGSRGGIGSHGGGSGPAGGTEPGGVNSDTPAPPDPNQTFEDWLKQQLTTGGFTDGGFSSGGGSGGGFSVADSAEFAYKQALADTYMRLWGEAIPASTLNMAVSQGMNIYEFEDWIRRQPAFKKTEVYQDEYADKLMQTARALGVLP